MFDNLLIIEWNGKKHKKEVTGMQWIGNQPQIL